MPTASRSVPLRVFVFASLAAVGTAAAAEGPLRQTPAAGPGSVVLDFRAVTEDGRPVLDLKPADLTLKIDGRDREIRSLEVFDFGRPRPGAAPPALTPAFGSNVIADGGRDVLLLVDDESIAPGRENSVRVAVEELLSGLAPRDRVGFVTVPLGGANLGFTSRRDEVRAALAAFTGRAPRAATAADIACRTRLTLGLLKGVFANHPSDVPTTVILLSSSLTAPSAVTRMVPSAQAGLCEVRPDDFNEVAAAAFASRAELHVAHVIDGADVGVSASAGSLSAGLESLAGVTGGEMLRLTGSQRGTLERLARETSAHYVLTFDPERGERDGKTHRTELGAARDGVRLRVRPRITIPAADDRPRADADVTAREMLREAAVRRGLPLRAAGYASRDTGGSKVKVVVLFEPSAAATQLDTAMVGMFDAKGKLTAQWTGQKAELSRTPVVAALLVPPGTYRLRVAATDLAGRSGSVDADVRAALVNAAPLTLSALALGAAVEGSFSPRLLFRDEQVVVGYVEVYGPPKNAAVTAVIELAESEDGPAAITLPARVPAQSGGDVLSIVGGIQVDRLPPGDYAVRMVVSLDGKPVGRVVRTLTKQGR